MNSITISLKETLRKAIPSTKIHCSCQIGDADFLLCTNNKVYHYSKLKESNNMKAYNYSFRTCSYIKELNSICAINASLPNISFYSLRSGFPLICESYRLSTTLYDTILYSPSTKPLIVAGDSVEIFEVTIEWKLFEVDPQILLNKKLSIPCNRMTSNIYLDEFRHILIVPTLFGFSTYDLLNLNATPSVLTNRVYQCNQISNLPFQTIAFYNSNKISTKTSTENVPFKKLLTTNSNGDICLWNSSSCRNGHPIQKFEKFNETPLFCEFIDNEFVLFVTENKPNYSVLLFDIKTSKSIKLVSFESKIIKMKVMSKLFVSFLTESYFVVYKINIPWHLYTKTDSNAVYIKRFPVYSNTLKSSNAAMKAARIGILGKNSIFSIYSPDVHFLLTEIGIPESTKIGSVIYDRDASLRIRDRIISNDNKYNNSDYFQPITFLNGKFQTEQVDEKSSIDSPRVKFNNSMISTNSLIQSVASSPLLTSKQKNDSKEEKITKLISTFDSKHTRERVIFLLEDGTFHVYHSINHKFIKYTESNSINLKSFLMTYIIKDEKNLEPTFFGVTGNNELMFFDFNSFDVTSRTQLKNDELKSYTNPLFTLIHHQTNTIYVLYEQKVFIVDASSKQIVCAEPLTSKPIFASLEDNLLLICFENRSIQLRHLKKQQAEFVYESPSETKKKEETIKLFEDVTFATVQYETFIIVTDNRTVRIGHTFENYATFEFPFDVFSAGFLNQDLDMLLGLDFEIMVIRRAFWYPFIEKRFDCIFDTSDVANESVISKIHSNARLSNLKPKANGLVQSLKNIEIMTINSDSTALNMSKSMASFQTSPKLKIRKFIKIPDLPPINQAHSYNNRNDLYQNEREKTMADEGFKKLFGDINNGLEQSTENKKSNTIPINFETKPGNNQQDEKEKDSEMKPISIETIKDENENDNEMKPKKVRKKRRVHKKHNNDDDDGDIKTEDHLAPQPPSEPNESSYHRNKNTILNSIESTVSDDLGNDALKEKNNMPDGIKNQRTDDETNCKLNNYHKENQAVIENHGKGDSISFKETESKENDAQEIVLPIDNQENLIDNGNNEQVVNSNEINGDTDNSQNLKSDKIKLLVNEIQENNNNNTLVNQNKNTKRFIPLSKTKSVLTTSSPDLIILQSKLWRLKLSVNKNQQPTKASTPVFSGRSLELPSIKVSLVTRNINRSKSEYHIIKSIEQSNELQYDKKSFYKVPENDILIDSNGKVHDDPPKQMFVNAIQKVLAEKPLSIKPLIIERDPSDYQKRSPRTKRNLLMGIKKVGIHPLGNVELALSIIKHGLTKK